MDRYLYEFTRRKLIYDEIASFFFNYFFTKTAIIPLRCKGLMRVKEDEKLSEEKRQ